jgi:hypothetical protein
MGGNHLAAITFIAGLTAESPMHELARRGLINVYAQVHRAPGPRHYGRIRGMSDAIPPGDPGHSNGHASIRLRPVRIDDDGMIRQGYTTQWELLCPACGDDGTKDYSAVPPEIQRVRGPYPMSSQRK